MVKSFLWFNVNVIFLLDFQHLFMYIFFINSPGIIYLPGIEFMREDFFQDNLMG